MELTTVGDDAPLSRRLRRSFSDADVIVVGSDKHEDTDSGSEPTTLGEEDVESDTDSAAVSSQSCINEAEMEMYTKSTTVDCLTTVTIRNLPSHFTREALLKFLD